VKINKHRFVNADKNVAVVDAFCIACNKFS